MASLEQTARSGHRPLLSASDDKCSIRRRRSSSSLNEAGPSPHRQVLQRQITPEMEMIEKGGKAENISMFDVVFPSSSSHIFLVVEDDDISYDESSGRIETDVSFFEDYSDSSERPRSQSPSMNDVDEYMARREMTPLQERMNAITVIPGAFYCFLFLLSGSWLKQSLVDDIMEATMDSNELATYESRCLSSSWLPHLHALPPLPVIAAAFGIICHAPFSFVYHWSYAHRLPAGFARTNHWSRRLDQAMIHFCSASMAYATSGRLDFFFANLLFNADCMYRQFQTKIRPRRNQMRIAISVVAYTIPILRRGEWELFGQLWAIFTFGFALFLLYPIGGWSHSAFHLVIALVPPLLMNAAIDLPASQEQLTLAAQCAALARQL